MSAEFNIQVDLNGWIVPFRIEEKGQGIFKIAYHSLLIGHVLLNEAKKCIYISNVGESPLLNAYTAEKIGEAIIKY